MKKLSRLLLPLCLVGLFIGGCKNKDASNNGREPVRFDKVGNWEILGQKTPRYITFFEHDSEDECVWQIMVHPDFNGKPQFSYTDHELFKNFSREDSLEVNFGGIPLQLEGLEYVYRPYSEGDSDDWMDFATTEIEEVLPILSKGNFDIVITNTKTGEQRTRHIGNETAQADEAYNKLIQLKKQ